MNIDIDQPLFSETLCINEVSEITGFQRKSDQADWLSRNGWIFHVNNAGHPIIGRMYARLRLAGITSHNLVTHSLWNPDFSKLR